MQPVISSSSQGAAGELIVCADLLRKGYGVFRSVSPHCAFDIIAYRNGAFDRIEVRTRRLNNDGGSSCPPGENRADVYAVVSNSSFEVRYFDTRTQQPITME